jgi:hypothetical protein
MTRAASLLLRVVGLALVLVAVMGFVLVGAGGAWTAHASVPAGRAALLVEPAVASVLGPSVTVHVTPADDDTTPYFLGRGRSDDLAAYAQDRDVVRVVGFDGSRRLALRDGPPPAPAGSAGSAPDPTAGSTTQPRPMTVDLWQQQVTGPRARELSWRPTPGARSILVAHEDGTALPALDVTVTWTEGRWLWYPVGTLVLGLALIAGGYALIGALPLDVVRARAAQLRSAVASRGPTPVRPSRRSRATTVPADESAPGPNQQPPADGPAPGPDPQPPAEPDVSPAQDPGTESVAPPVSEVLPSRRATRGRRRKETVWQRARAKAMSRAGGRR